MGGGGGGDGGAQERAQRSEASKQAARDALNLQFGVGGGGSAPTREQFMRPATTGGQMGVDFEGNPALPMGGGDPGGFDEAGFNAAQARYDAATANGNSRDALYKTVRDNSYSAGKRGLDEQREAAARKTKFELFARGLAGGSEDVDQNAMLGRTYSQGLIDLGGKADLAESQFRGDDEQTRLSLLQSIDGGMDEGSASSSAMAQMRINADRAAAEASGTSLGDLFANTSLIYNKSQAAQGKQAGTEWWNQYGATSGRKGGTSPSGFKTSLPGE